jgi:nitrile hydratase
MIPQFQSGQCVRVKHLTITGHVRTPAYLRGRIGTITEVSGAYPDPNKLADGELGLPYQMLYRVQFEQKDIWPDYEGPSSDALIADIYEPWLEPLETDR